MHALTVTTSTGSTFTLTFDDRGTATVYAAKFARTYGYLNVSME